MRPATREQNAPDPTTAWTPWLAWAASVLAIALAAGCVSTPFDEASLGLPPTTQLALSPDGQKLVVFWPEGEGHARARLLTLSGTAVTSVREVALPGDTFTIAYGRTGDHVLVTTRSKDGGELVKVDLQGASHATAARSSSMRK